MNQFSAETHGPITGESDGGAIVDASTLRDSDSLNFIEFMQQKMDLAAAAGADLKEAELAAEREWFGF
jgi:hypothetical protein